MRVDHWAGHRRPVALPARMSVQSSRLSDLLLSFVRMIPLASLTPYFPISLFALAQGVCYAGGALSKNKSSGGDAWFNVVQGGFGWFWDGLRPLRSAHASKGGNGRTSKKKAGKG